MNTEQTVNVGYSVSKHGYRAVAFVADRLGYHTRRTGLGSSKQEAERDAIDYIRDTYAREGLEFPQTGVVRHGRMSAAYIENIFGLMADPSKG